MSGGHRRRTRSFSVHQSPAAAGKRRFVNNPDPAADAEKLDRDNAAFKSRISGATFCDRFGERRRVGDLRADVHLDAAEQDVRHPRRLFVNRRDAIQRDAEFVFAAAGGDIAMRAGIDIGIHAQARSARARLCSRAMSIDAVAVPPRFRR